jgi:hypothetical protein
MSDIDPSVIRDDQKVAKSDLREQLQIAANEITALQLLTSITRRMAYDDASFDTI